MCSKDLQLAAFEVKAWQQEAKRERERERKKQNKTNAAARWWILKMFMEETDVFSHGFKSALAILGKEKKNLLRKFTQAMPWESVKVHTERTWLVTAGLQYVYRDVMVIVALSHRWCGLDINTQTAAQADEWKPEYCWTWTLLCNDIRQFVLPCSSLVVVAFNVIGTPQRLPLIFRSVYFPQYRMTRPTSNPIFSFPKLWTSPLFFFPTLPGHSVWRLIATPAENLQIIVRLRRKKINGA